VNRIRLEQDKKFLRNIELLKEPKGGFIDLNFAAQEVALVGKFCG